MSADQGIVSDSAVGQIADRRLPVIAPGQDSGDSEDDGIGEDDEINQVANNIHASNKEVDGAASGPNSRSNPGVTLGQGFPSLSLQRENDQANAEVNGNVPPGESFTNRSEFIRKHRENRAAGGGGSNQMLEKEGMSFVKADSPVQPESSDEANY